MVVPKEAVLARGGLHDTEGPCDVGLLLHSSRQGYEEFRGRFR